MSLFIQTVEAADIAKVNTPKNTDYILLSDYGAIGDGSFDNYEFLCAAISDAISQKKPLKLPSGIYYSSKMLSINGPIKIFSDTRSSATIIFRDNVQYGIKPEYWQRGIVTFRGSGLILDNITLQYESNIATQYTRTPTSSGHEGVLFSAVDATNITLKNVRFIVSGSQNPSVTCAWLKSETSDIRNVTITNCVFDHITSSTVSGGLWVSSNDNKTTCLDNIAITGCTFNEYAHDESMSIWGYRISNASISNNTYNYLGTSTFAETLVALGAYENATLFENVTFKGNIFNIKNNVKTALQIGNIPKSASISVANNTFYATISECQEFSCLGIFDCGNTFISDNVFNIRGGRITSFILMDRTGNVVVDNASFSSIGSNKCLIVRSRYSQNNAEAKIEIINSNLEIASSNTEKRIPSIQFPKDGSFSIRNTSVAMNNSAVKEIVFQALSSPAINSNNGKVEFSSLTTDASLILCFKEFGNTKISSKDSKFNELYLFCNGNNPKTEQLEISNCIYNNIYINGTSFNP
jgi:hypothetical protein